MPGIRIRQYYKTTKLHYNSETRSKKPIMTPNWLLQNGVKIGTFYIIQSRGGGKHANLRRLSLDKTAPGFDTKGQRILFQIRKKGFGTCVCVWHGSSKLLPRCPWRSVYTVVTRWSKVCSWRAIPSGTLFVLWLTHRAKYVCGVSPLAALCLFYSCHMEQSLFSTRRSRRRSDCFGCHVEYSVFFAHRPL